MAEIHAYTIVTDDPEAYLPHVAREVAEGYFSGYVDHANHWSLEFIGYSEDEDDEV